MIASLTSCSVAQYIDSITSRHHILHYAIPRPMCLERPSMPEGETMHTMWYQPEARDLANALYKINEFENADRGLILGNGQSSKCGPVWTHLRIPLGCQSSILYA
ncbi:unnamed protein product [Echinostoma caproni]|uniref:ANF_receptor domain-containing protein n=1 Tax=Echinostoma caproni TaxID=27848 RepID=A0A183A343_9TREM|nr:unnamed protein product [Echinostoma caproni]